MKKNQFCRNCKCQTNYEVIADKEKSGEEIDEKYGMVNLKWIETYSIIECSGCGTVSFLLEYADTDMIEDDGTEGGRYYSDKTVFPYYLKKTDSVEHLHYIPLAIRNIYEESIEAFKAKLFILTAVGFRATIEAVCKHLKIKGKDLLEKIDKLQVNNHLTKKQAHRLHSIRYLGNDAVHEIDAPDEDALFLLLEIVNELLLDLFIRDRILTGKVVRPIESFRQFLNLIRSNIKPEMIGRKYQIGELLGRQRRLVLRKDLRKYESDLIKEIKDGKHAYMKIYDDSDEKKVIYEIESNPPFSVFLG